MVAGNLLGVVSGLLKATSAGYHSDQSRSAADAPGRAGQSTFLVSSLRGTGMRSRRSGPRLEIRRRIVGIRRRVAAAVACPSPRVSGLLLPLRFARYAASRSARSGKKTSRLLPGLPLENFPPRAKGPVRRLLEGLRRLAVVARKPRLRSDYCGKFKRQVFSLFTPCNLHATNYIYLLGPMAKIKCTCCKLSSL